MEYGAEFEQLCQTLFQYQYVKNPAELDAATVRWLYEHSNGIVSSVVMLLHDAQEIAILEGSEFLSLQQRQSWAFPWGKSAAYAAAFAITLPA